MRAAFKPSGDLIADRRFDYGQSLFREGDFAAAADLFQQAAECAPAWPAAHFHLGKARREAGDRAGAGLAFREALRLDPDDQLGASLALAELDAAVMIDAAPAAYVRALFDAYAEDFDKALVERLAYSTPQQLAALLRETRVTQGPEAEGRFGRALDLGCGTGLAGEAIRRDVAWIEGVDLSSAMIETARAKGVYDTLETAEILVALHHRHGAYEVIMAADVLNYFGALQPVLTAVAACLSPQGVFVFSVEKATGGEFSVQPSMRFAHSADYVARVVKGAGLDLAAMREAVLRKDRGEDVAGLLIAARMPKTPARRLPTTGDGAFLDTPASIN